MRLLILSLFVFFLSCGDDEAVLPACIDQLLEEFKLEACQDTGDLTLWEFNGRDVYCFQLGVCIADAGADIYDEDCNHLCFLGGIAELTLCEGLNWEENAVYKTTLYIH